MSIEKLRFLFQKSRPEEYNEEDLEPTEETLVPIIPSRIKKVQKLAIKKRFIVTDQNGLAGLLFRQATDFESEVNSRNEIISKFFINGGSLPEDGLDVNYINSILGGNIMITQSPDGSNLITCPSIQEAFMHGKQFRLGDLGDKSTSSPDSHTS